MKIKDDIKYLVRIILIIKHGIFLSTVMYINNEFMLVRLSINILFCRHKLLFPFVFILPTLFVTLTKNGFLKKRFSFFFFFFSFVSFASFVSFLLFFLLICIAHLKKLFSFLLYSFLFCFRFFHILLYSI